MNLLDSYMFRKSAVLHIWSRIAIVFALLVIMVAISGAQSSISAVPRIFAPLLQGPENTKLRKLADQLYDEASFSRLSSIDRKNFNSQLMAEIRNKGGILKEAMVNDPEAYFQMALVFLLDMERISKMGSTTERSAMVYAYPDKIKGYLTKYVTLAPNGRFVATAQKILSASAKNK